MSFVSNTRILSDPAFCCRLSDQGKPIYSIHFDVNFNPNHPWKSWNPIIELAGFPHLPPKSPAMHRYASLCPKDPKMQKYLRPDAALLGRGPGERLQRDGHVTHVTHVTRCGDPELSRPGDETVAVKSAGGWDMGDV
jgi:hypothetical protein